MGGGWAPSMLLYELRALLSISVFMFLAKKLGAIDSLIVFVAKQLLSERVGLPVTLKSAKLNIRMFKGNGDLELSDLAICAPQSRTTKTKEAKEAKWTCPEIITARSVFITFYISQSLHALLYSRATLLVADNVCVEGLHVHLEGVYEEDDDVDLLSKEDTAAAAAASRKEAAGGGGGGGSSSNNSPRKEKLKLNVWQIGKDKQTVALLAEREAIKGTWKDVLFSEKSASSSFSHSAASPTNKDQTTTKREEERERKEQADSLLSFISSFQIGPHASGLLSKIDSFSKDVSENVDAFKMRVSTSTAMALNDLKEFQSEVKVEGLLAATSKRVSNSYLQAKDKFVNVKYSVQNSIEEHFTQQVGKLHENLLGSDTDFDYVEDEPPRDRIWLGGCLLILNVTISLVNVLPRPLAHLENTPINILRVVMEGVGVNEAAQEQSSNGGGGGGGKEVLDSSLNHQSNTNAAEDDAYRRGPSLRDGWVVSKIQRRLERALVVEAVKTVTSDVLTEIMTFGRGSNQTLVLQHNNDE